MIKRTLQLFVFLFVVVGMNYSCGKAVAARCDSYSTAVVDELEDVSSTLQAYISDPTIANCNAYKAAQLVYLDAAEDIFDCVPTASRSSWEAQIDEAKKSVDELDCM